MNIEMKKCPECGELIPFTSKFCPNCGERLVITESPANDERKDFFPDEDASKEIDSIAEDAESGTVTSGQRNGKKKAGLIGLIVVVLIIILSTVLLSPTSSLSEDEKGAVSIVKQYQSILKDPDSLILRSDIACVEASDGDGMHEYYIFTASATNSYGASVQDVVIYVDGEYVEYVSDPDESDFDAEEEYEEYMDAYRLLILYFAYGEGEGSTNDYVCTMVDGEIIADKLGVEFSE